MEIELIEQAATEIAEYSKTEAGLTALRERMAGVAYDLTTTKGMIVARADRAEVRSLRTGLEATRKEIKAPALAHCKLIDEEAKRITAEVLVLTGEMVVVPVQSSRPTDRAMLAAIAEHFAVTDRQAFDWLDTFDFDATSDELLEEEREL